MAPTTMSAPLLQFGCTEHCLHVNCNYSPPSGFEQKKHEKMPHFQKQKQKKKKKKQRKKERKKKTTTISAKKSTFLHYY